MICAKCKVRKAQAVLELDDGVYVLQCFACLIDIVDQFPETAERFRAINVDKAKKAR